MEGKRGYASYACGLFVATNVRRFSKYIGPLGLVRLPDGVADIPNVGRGQVVAYLTGSDRDQERLQIFRNDPSVWLKEAVIWI